MSDEKMTDLEAAEAAANSLNEENAKLRDELGRYKAAANETDDERRQRWGQELLDGLLGAK